MKNTRFILPNAFTSMNFFFFFFAVCWATGLFSTLSSADPFRMSAYFVILCVLLDKLDGFAARLVNASSAFGAQFDSLADLIAFGIAPAIGLIFSYKTLAPEWFSQNLILLLIVFSIYVLCAAMRLAKYNAMDSDSYHHHFSGLPSTFAGALNVILLAFMQSKNLLSNSASLIMFVPVFTMLVSALLMVSPLFLPKLQIRKNKIINAGQIILIVLTYISGFFFITDKIPYICEFLLAEMAIYIVVGFGSGLIHRKEIIEEAQATSN